MAGTVLGYMKFVLGFDSIGFKKGMTESERDLVKLQKKFQGIGDKMTSLGKTMTIGITAPLAAIGLKSFETAKDFQEMESAFDVSFGNMSASVRKWAEETGNAMGRSTMEMQSGALAFQELFSKALDPAKSAEMSKTFAVLTQDLASFKNLSNEVAQQKLFSGLSGEAEPLRAVGVFLSAAKVEAKALEMGLVGVNGKLSEEQKILARAAVIQEELAKASGDVIRTQDSAANQIKKAQAAWNELQIVIGTKVLPLLTPLITKIASLLEWFTKLSPQTQSWALTLAAVAAAAGPLLVVLGALTKLLAGSAILVQFAAGLTGIGVAAGTTATGATAAGIAVRALLGPIGLAITAATALYLAWKNWDKIAPMVQRMVDGVKNALAPIGNYFKRVEGEVLKFRESFFHLYDKVVGRSYVPDMVDEIGVQMARLESVMVNPAQKGTAKVSEAFAAMRSSVHSLLDQLFPEQARFNQFQADLATLEKGMKQLGFTAEQTARAVSELTMKFGRESGVIEEEAFNWPTEVEVELPDVEKSLDQFQIKTSQVTADVIESFGDMAVSTIGSIREMRDMFKSGDVLGGIEVFLNLILDVLTALGQMGVLKLPGMTTPPYGGARARGGPIVPGKSYLVGENGPEYVTPARRGYVNPNKGLAPQTIRIVPSPYFDAVVDNRAGQVAAPMAGRAAMVGVQGAEMRMARQSRRNLLGAR
jgi:hypothetical protein